MDTAGQAARPRPDANVAQHPSENFRYGEPQSVGDRGGPGRFYTSGTPTSGGPIKSRFSTDKKGSRSGQKLYLGKAFENAQRPHFAAKRGNSEGRAEVPSKTETNTVKKAAQARLSKGNGNDRKATGDEYAGQPFRKEAPNFGPIRPDRKTVARDHGEHRDATAQRARRMEPGGMAPVHQRSGA